MLESINIFEQRFQERTTTHDYNGPSMNPTLWPGDGMVVVPYAEGESVRVGDVVVFFDPEKDRNIVHRVISVKEQGIRTRGDNNDQVDSIILQPEDISGKVVSVFRKNKTIRIRNGWQGHLLGGVLRTRKTLQFKVFKWLHPWYFGLARSGIFRLPPKWLGLQVLSFQRPKGTEMYLRLWNRWTVGMFYPECHMWRLRRPFKLFIDEDSLPTPKEE